jgi:uncharacterized protein (DUF305 family)
VAIRKTSIGILFAVVVACIIAGIWFMLSGGKLLGSSPQLNNDTAITGKTNTPPSDPTKYGYGEISFAKQMIIYNQQATELGNIAQHGEVSADIKKFTDEVVATHGKTTDRYAKWLNEWNENYLNLSDFPREDGHDAYPTTMGMPTVKELDKMATMPAGEKDKEFLRLLLQLHEGVLEYMDTFDDDVQYKEMKDYLAIDKAHYAQEVKSIKDLQHTQGQH